MRKLMDKLHAEWDYISRYFVGYPKSEFKIDGVDMSTHHYNIVIPIFEPLDQVKLDCSKLSRYTD